MRKIALLGGTGNEGRGLGARLALAGETVILGSRSKERAERAARSVRDLLGTDAGRILAAVNAEAASQAEVVFVCVPSAALAAVLPVVAPIVRGKTVIDVVNPVAHTKKGFEPGIIEGARSAAELAARLLPDARVVSAFKTLSAHKMLDVASPLAGDTFVCGDAADAKAVVFDLVARMPRLRAVDAGPLRNSRFVEAATILLLEINARHKATTSLQLIGLDQPPAG